MEWSPYWQSEQLLSAWTVVISQPTHHWGGDNSCEWTDFSAHAAPATRLRISADDFYLFSAAEDTAASPEDPVPGVLKRG